MPLATLGHDIHTYKPSPNTET